MLNKNKNPYKKCPRYETEQFIFRMVEESDAEDLLECYSDSVAAKIFNSDNCTSNFRYKTLDEMINCIKFWIDEYEKQYYIRFSIIDKIKNKAIGTIEIFAKNGDFENSGRVGVLRLDLASEYEKTEIIKEILEMIDDNFFDVFEIDSIITKAISDAKYRIIALESYDYKKLENKTIVPYDFYYIKKNQN